MFLGVLSRRAIRRLWRLERFYQKRVVSQSLRSLAPRFRQSLLRWKSTNSNQKQPFGSPERPHDQPGSWQQLIPLIVLAALYLAANSKDPTPDVTWSVFLKEMLLKGEVRELVVNSSRDRCFVYLHKGAVIYGKEVGPPPQYSFSISSADSLEKKLMQAQEELGIDPSGCIPVTYQSDSDTLSMFISAVISFAIFGGIAYVLLRRMGGTSQGGVGSLMQFGKARPVVILDSTNGVKFSEIAGMSEAKREVKEFVDYLTHPQTFTNLGAKIPKGALLTGPPGTGKTMLAKAVASEASVPFLSMAGPDFVEVFAGVGASRVRDLFSQARKTVPCIVYIDEIDAVGQARRSNASMGGHNEQENTLNQLLVEMDGINTLEGVVMMASTNRPDVLDQALLRPGRFDRRIHIDLPTLLEREAIFAVYLKKYKLAQSWDEYTKRLAALTPGHSGADIANICNEAALHAARHDHRNIDSIDFEYAVERVIAGMEKKNNMMLAAERKVVAYHEAGHAVVGWFLRHADPVLKISIIPRTKGPLGYTQHLPSDQKLYSPEQLFDRMCVLLGGRAAEALTFRKITTGAHDDLKKVTELAYVQIQVFGMNSKVGHVSFPMKRSRDVGQKPFSQKLSKVIDEEARQLVEKVYQKTEEILTQHEEKLKALSEALLEKEVLNQIDIEELLGPRPL
ncbi:mitochondrial inner membrane m-AAA protease component paraplegin-like [Oscarella lobularis]|uniref:mitochondrial inner membrane m-AAA protease component paraplegin-like n=1 Tax=Oscarella lobularis TaxID=121494 RepID=UPI0033135522